MATQQQTADNMQSDPVGPGGVKRRDWKAILLSALILAALAGFVTLFSFRAFPGYVGRQGCDIAQIARNISSGKGFTTSFIRPFNTSFSDTEEQRLPELNRAPACPYLLATAFRVMGASDQTTARTSALCFILLLCATALLGFLLFDARAGLLGAAALGLSAPTLQTAISGQEWAMAAVWFTLLLCVVALYHKASAESRSGACICYSALAAVLLAMLYATSYATLFLALPIGVYFGITGKTRRASLATFLLLTIVLISPLLYINYSNTGSPMLGVSAWDVMSNSMEYPGDSLYRSVHKELARPAAVVLFPIEHFPSFARKLMVGSLDLFTAMLPMLGLIGLPFAAVSALYRFKSMQANAVRGLCYGAAAVMLLVFASLSVPVDSMILFCPVIVVTGAAYLFLLLDAKRLHPVFVRFILIGLIAVTAVPAVSTMIWTDIATSATDSHSRLAAVITDMQAGRTRVGYYNKDMLVGLDIANSPFPIYTDQPWSVAWRADRVSVWLPSRAEDIEGLLDWPIRVVMLTPECEKYARTDLWRVLHMSSWWRAYNEDPQSAASDSLRAMNVSPEIHQNWQDSFRQQRHQLSIPPEALPGLKRAVFVLLNAYPRDPYYPEESADIQILIRDE